MATRDETVRIVSNKLEAIIRAYYPAPQCALEKIKWDKDIVWIKKQIADRLGGNGININVGV